MLGPLSWALLVQLWIQLTKGNACTRARKGPGCLRNSRTERRKALRVERVWQDQARCREQRRTRGCTTQDACLRQTGQWNCRWDTGLLAAVTYKTVGETSCRAYWWQTVPPAAITYMCAQFEKDVASSGLPHDALHSLVDPNVYTRTFRFYL